MVRLIITGCVFLSAVSLATAHAEIYTWKDAQGTTNFTEDPGKIPMKFRKKAKPMQMDGDSSAGMSATSVAGNKGADTSTKVAPLSVAGKGDTAGGELFGGKTYDQWRKDLSDREAAMGTLRKRIDEVADQVKSPALKRGEQQKLISEHAALVKQFNEEKAQYNQQVETARKAGLPITIQQ